MPDWSYRPLFAPWMLRMPAFSQALVLTKMRLIGSTPLLYKIIDLMGHMRPGAALKRSFAGLDLVSPLGMSSAIDPAGKALLAFERFGYGFVEVGPVAAAKGESAEALVTRGTRAMASARTIAVDDAVANLVRAKTRVGVKRFVRVAPGAGVDVVTRIAPHADALLVPRELAAAAKATGKPWGLVLRLLEAGEETASGKPDFFVLDPDGQVLAPSDKTPGERAIRTLRRAHPTVPVVYSGGGVECPEDALDLLEAGATAVTLSHGFLFTGPGTPKRINAALGAPDPMAPVHPEPETLLDCARFAWFWCLLHGLALMFGSVLAAYFAMTKVILPYDEAASGVTREQVLQLNPKVLSFMAHDRFTLAGTMLSLGLLFAGLSWFGIRRGRIWAQEAVVYSGTLGFLTFFAFVGYGYFDQFHAFVAVAMLPTLIQGATRWRTAMRPTPLPDLVNDRAYRFGAVGQLLFVVEAVGLILAGLVIMLVGANYVFVETDLAFLGMTGEAMASVYPRLVPLIAHDRATFGGMLFSSGIAVLLTALWGFARGERWIWNTLWVGFFAYAATLWIHADIAYTDPLHLSPVFIGILLHGIGLALSRRFLTGSG